MTSPVVLLLVAFMAIYACAACPTASQSRECEDALCHSTSVRLLAGQHHEAGQVVISNNEDEVCVSLELQNGWKLRTVNNAVKVHITTSPNQLPTNPGGNLVPGQFCYKSSETGCDGCHTVCFSREAFPQDTLYFAVHADVGNDCDDSCVCASTETAWGEGTPIGKNWAMYVTYEVNSEPCPSNVVICSGSETAYGKAASGSKCFTEFAELSSNNWGWSNLIDVAGDHVLTLFAGAGQCDTSKGAEAGEATISCDNGRVTVDYQFSSGWLSGGCKHYYGTGPLPINPNNGRATVAPGQYESASSPVICNEPYWVIVHCDVEHCAPA